MDGLIDCFTVSSNIEQYMHGTQASKCSHLQVHDA